MENQCYHIPVLLSEAVEALNLKNGKTIVDATLGGGGHSTQIAKTLESGTLICIDQDINAINNSKSKIKATFVHDNYENISAILDSLKTDKIDGILADLGVSNHQIDTPVRGFSYMHDAPLDMRMDATNNERMAHHVVNNYPPAKLNEIIRDYGEERYHNRITQAIVAARPVQTTLQLADIIKGAVPGNYYKTGGHPAKRTFQAIRIEVNQELASIEKLITSSVQRLNKNGRIAIISFHSLEDRIVKQTFKHLATDCICPPRSPQCICHHRATLRLITKKPIEPTLDEIKRNPRSASAKLRIAEKI
jgi:16S rRNA (cytosine1402-N4)-methyltransferase